LLKYYTLPDDSREPSMRDGGGTENLSNKIGEQNAS
jgi:hypothetical protein